MKKNKKNNEDDIVSFRDFLESDKYTQLKEELNNEINHNSQMFNTEIRQYSNLIDHGVRSDEFKKDEHEKQKLKLLKKEYKNYINTLHGKTIRDEFLKSFVNNLDHTFPRYNCRLIFA